MKLSSLRNNLFVQQQNINSGACVKQNVFTSINRDVVSFSGLKSATLAEIKELAKPVLESKTIDYPTLNSVLLKIKKFTEGELKKEDKEEIFYLCKTYREKYFRI